MSVTALFIGLATILLAEATAALAGGWRFLRCLRAARDRQPGRFAPPLTLVVPCRGIDPNLELNLRAYAEQMYPDFQLLFVTADATDPSVPILQRVRAEYGQIAIRVLFAGACESRGQKVHNLLYAVKLRRPRDAVIAFGDSDIRPGRQWLRHLVDDLADPAVGVNTGFRWYLPTRRTFGSVLRAVWNAAAASMMAGRPVPFAWGGAMAVRCETFDRCRVTEYWRGAASDDLALTRAMHDHGKRIRFEPHCLSFTDDACSVRQLLAWAARQLTILRVYSPRLWAVGFGSELFSAVAFWGGWIVVVWPARASGPAPPVLAALLIATYLTRSVKGWLRLRAFGVLFPRQRAEMAWSAWAYLTWSPLTSLVSLAGFLSSAFRRVIRWRGIRYRLASPMRTVVLDRSP